MLFSILKIFSLNLHAVKFFFSYSPPWLWGRNGHVQTAVYGVLGRHMIARVAKKRYYVSLKDGTTVTFDVFEPSPGQERGQFFIIKIFFCIFERLSVFNTCVRKNLKAFLIRIKAAASLYIRFQ